MKPETVRAKITSTKKQIETHDFGLHLIASLLRTIEPLDIARDLALANRITNYLTRLAKERLP